MPGATPEATFTEARQAMLLLMATGAEAEAFAARAQAITESAAADPAAGSRHARAMASGATEEVHFVKRKGGWYIQLFKRRR